MAIIETENLWKSFRVRRRTVEAVRGIHLSVHKGEMFAFLGPNGAGKSTTLRMLTTLLPPDKGRAVVAGYDVKSNPNSVRSSIGYVSQNGGSDAMMTGRENIITQAQCYNLPVGLLLTLGLMVLVALCLSSCSYALALMLRDANALASFLNTLSLPALLLSGITLPLTLAPPIIQHIALIDPFAYVVNAARLLFRGVMVNGAILEGYVIMAVLALLAMVWGVRAFLRATTA